MVTVEVRGLNGLLAGLESAPEVYAREQGLAMAESLSILKGEISERTPVRSGRLAAGWRSEVRSLSPVRAEGHVFNSVSYAVDVEYDTRGHEIVAHGRALEFPTAPEGFVKRVRHPGTRGKHMAREGTTAARPLIQQRWVAVAKAILRSVRVSGA